MKSVFIVDDHDIVRFGLETLFSACQELHMLGSSPNLTEGLARIAELEPDIVICDMSMDDSKGLDTVRAVVKAQGERPVLIISMHDESMYGERVLALGAKGYLMKESAYAHAVPAALQVLAGGQYLSPTLTTQLLNRLMKRSSKPSGSGLVEELTKREIDVLEKLGQGKTTKEIAMELVLSVRTVDIHRANIKRKLCLKTGAGLVAFALSRT